MSKYVRKGVNFNVDNEHQRKVLEWAARKGRDNFSGFVKAILYAAMSAELKQKRDCSDSSADD
ncbi:hypothetical protein [Paenibacillus odorifer]|uniref:Uncharacterized protein n=1 Tax=Paenibacillus odorifer TaxID=189426 RepID=A0A1R0XAZ0_9BACL|nr:hypothetical protein [Paenibacillus odorifer]OMD32099.1 hypothetical protein BJP51_16010 [Paenibacillus odorifer]